MTAELSNVIPLPRRSNRQAHDAVAINADLAAAVGEEMSSASFHVPATVAAVARAPLILFRGDPLKSAKEILAKLYTSAGLRVLASWRGVFYQWDGTHYAEVDEGTTKANLWKLLGDAYVMDGRKTVPFCPTRKHVAEVHDALAALSAMPSNKEPPAWL